MSRSLAAHEGKLSRGVSLKTLHECLDKICHDLSMLWVQSFKKKLIFKNSKFMSILGRSAAAYGLDKYDRAECQNIVLNACGSFVDEEMSNYDTNPIEFNDSWPYKWTMCDSDTNCPY